MNIGQAIKQVLYDYTQQSWEEGSAHAQGHQVLVAKVHPNFSHAVRVLLNGGAQKLLEAKHHYKKYHFFNDGNYLLLISHEMETDVPFVFLNDLEVQIDTLVTEIFNRWLYCADAGMAIFPFLFWGQDDVIRSCTWQNGLENDLFVGSAEEGQVIRMRGSLEQVNQLMGDFLANLSPRNKVAKEVEHIAELKKRCISQLRGLTSSHPATFFSDILPKHLCQSITGFQLVETTEELIPYAGKIVLFRYEGEAPYHISGDCKPSYLFEQHEETFVGYISNQRHLPPHPERTVSYLKMGNYQMSVLNLIDDYRWHGLYSLSEWTMKYKNFSVRVPTLQEINAIETLISQKIVKFAQIELMAMQPREALARQKASWNESKCVSTSAYTKNNA